MTPDKISLGKPLPLSDDDLDTLAEVTPEDIEAAKKLVKEASPKLAELLDAEEVEE